MGEDAYANGPMSSLILVHVSWLDMCLHSTTLLDALVSHRCHPCCVCMLPSILHVRLTLDSMSLHSS